MEDDLEISERVGDRPGLGVTVIIEPTDLLACIEEFLELDSPGNAKKLVT